MDITIYRYSDLKTMAYITSTMIIADKDGSRFDNFSEYFAWALGHVPSPYNFGEFIVGCEQCKSKGFYADWSFSNLQNVYHITYALICERFKNMIDNDDKENEWIADISDDALFIKSIEDYSFDEKHSIETKNMYLLRAIKALTKSLA